MVVPDPNIPTCDQCGQQHVTPTGKQACAGHAKHSSDKRQAAGLKPGSPCRHAPMRGQAMCHVHGGKARQNRQAAARRQAQAQIQADAAAILASEGIDPVDDPVREIGRLAVEALALKTAAGARTNALGAGIRYEDAKGSEQLRSEVYLYERALDRAMRFLEIAARNSDGGTGQATSMLGELFAQIQRAAGEDDQS